MLFLWFVLACGLPQHIRESQEREEATRLLQQIKITSPDFVHQRQALQMRVQAPSELTVVMPNVPTQNVGSQTFPLEVKYKSVTVHHPFNYRVVSANSSPWFPLEEGNEWTYNAVVTSTKNHGRSMGLNPLKLSTQKTERKSLTLIVGPSKVVEGHLEYAGTVRYNKVQKDLRLLPINGETHYWNGSVWTPLIIVEDAKTPTPFATEHVRCEMDLPGFSACLCYARPEGTHFAPAGPLECNPFSKEVTPSTQGDQAFWAVITLELYATNNKGSQKRAFAQGSFATKSPSVRDSDPLWAALHPQKRLSTSAWIRTLNTLSPQHVWDIEVAAALYLHHDSERKRDALTLALRGAIGRERLIELAPKGSPERVTFEADLHLGTDTSFTKQLLLKRKALTSPEAVERILLAIDKNLFDPTADTMLLQAFEDDITDSICDTLSELFEQEQLKVFWEHTQKVQPETAKNGLRQYQLQRHLGLNDPDPFLDQVAAAVLKKQWANEYLPFIKQAAEAHSISIDAAQRVLGFTEVEPDQLKVLLYMEPRLAKGGRDRLLERFTFEKARAAHILGVPQP